MRLEKSAPVRHAEPMLTARPPGVLAQAYDVYDGAQLVGSTRFHVFSQRGEIELSGRTLTIDRDGLAGPWRLHSGPRVIATAERPSILRRRWIIKPAEGAPLELTPTSWSIRNVTLRQAGVPIGSISRTSVLKREARIDLPEELGIEVTMFVFWLTALIWRRAAQSSG